MLWIVDIDNQKRFLSKLYNLFSSLQVVKDHANSQWEVNLNIEISAPIWDRICSFNYNFSLNVVVKV